MRCQVAFRRKLRKLPDAPGVYFFLGGSRRILYIGRASSLRNRVRSYFAPDIAEKRSSWIARMLGEARSVDFKKTDSVLEAVLLEADLIKKFQPLYNTDEKDDKSFNCVVITREDFPRVLIVRGRDINSSLIHNSRFIIHFQYGPYPAGFHLQTAMKLIRRIFPYRDATCTLLIPPLQKEVPSRRGGGFKSLLPKTAVLPLGKGELKTGKPCFNRQIGLCPGTCTGEISKQEYAKTIRNLRLFFEGKKTRLLKLLEREMKAAAKKQEFEKAGELKRQLFALRHIQDIALLKRELVSASVPRSRSASVQRTFRIEAFDLSHFGGKDIVGAMAVAENGVARPSEYRLFKIRGSAKQNDIAGLQEIIRRRLAHREWRFPNLIVVDGNKVQKRAAESVLAGFGQNIAVVAVVKDEHHKPREIIGFHGHSNILKNVGMSWRDDMERAILLANAEAHRFVLRFQRCGRS